MCVYKCIYIYIHIHIQMCHTHVYAEAYKNLVYHNTSQIFVFNIRHQVQTCSHCVLRPFTCVPIDLARKPPETPKTGNCSRKDACSTHAASGKTCSPAARKAGCHRERCNWGLHGCWPPQFYNTFWSYPQQHA